MDDLTRTQLDQIGEVRSALGAERIRWWLFGGWGLDARIGRITRDHHDLEFWVFEEDAPATRAALVDRGFVALPMRYPEESQEFVKDGVDSSSAFLWRNDDGSVGVRGRWSNWHFPPDAFQAPPGRLRDLEVPAMSVAGMIAMKEQYPTLRNGQPLREKDVADLRILRQLLETGTVPPAESSTG